MKDILRLIIALTVISAAAGVILAVTNKVTTTPIAMAAQKETVEALAAVLPPFDNNPNPCVASFTENGQTWNFHVGRKAGVFTGAAFEAIAPNGYGGEIRMMVGITASNEIQRIKILAQKETPGLGTKITEPPFISQFDGKRIQGTVWAVKKDQGDFDAVTGATISSRAVLGAIKAGLDVYGKHAGEIARTGE
jgi:electron transport complex protein RnfG